MIHVAWPNKPPMGTPINPAWAAAWGLVGCWPMWEGSGDKIFDQSGNGNPGTLANMNPATDWIPGKDGATVRMLADSNDYIPVPYSPVFNEITNAATLVLFGRWHTVGTSAIRSSGLVRYNSGASKRVWHTCLKNDGSVEAYYDDDGSAYTAAYLTATGVVYSLGDYFSIASTCMNGTILIYADGILRQTNSSGPASIDSSTDQKVHFGLSDEAGLVGDSQQNGISVSLGLIFSRALTPSQVMSLHMRRWQPWDYVLPFSVAVAPTLYTQSLAGGLTPAGVIIKKTMHGFGGGLTPAGVLANLGLFGQQLAGGITPTGAITKKTMHSLAGGIMPSGAVKKKTVHSLAGGVTPTGVIRNAAVFLKSLAGGLTPTGTIANVLNPILLRLRMLLGVGR